MVEDRRKQGGKRVKAVQINKRISENRPYYKSKEFGFYWDYDMNH